MSSPRSTRLRFLALACLLSLGLPSLGHASGAPVAAPAAPHAVVAAPQAAAPQANGAPRVVSLAEVGALVGKRVYVGTASGTPMQVVAKIRVHGDATGTMRDAFYMSTPLGQDHFAKEATGHLRPNFLFIPAGGREAATEGRGVRIRDDLFNLSKRIENGEFGLDTVVVNVSTPNAAGLVSLGMSGDLTMSAIKQVLASGGKVIGVVNPHVPFTRGNNTIEYKRLAAVLNSEDELPLLPKAPTGIAEKEIAANIARLIPDDTRSTLQVGIGAALDDLGDALKDKKLRIWSEMGGDWMIPLMASEYPAASEATVSFLLGRSPWLSKIVADSPAYTVPWIKVDSSGVVNNPQTIAKQPHMVAVNTALQVDLTGNTNGEEINGRVISAPGGQPNFMQGASMAQEGKAVLAIRSTNKQGESTITAKLSGPVTTPSKFVDYVVTEWGATERMRGMSDADRTYQVLRVAHPFHRPQLAKDAFIRGALTKPHFDELIQSVYPSLLKADARIRRVLTDGALQHSFITPEQHTALIASIPAGTTPEPFFAAPPVAPAQVAK